MAAKKKRKKQKSKPRGYVRISSAKQEEMFAAWCEKPTVRHVSHKCAVHHNTVKRYRKLDNWDERYNGIKAKANAKIDGQITNDLSKRIAGYKAMCNAGLNYWLKELNAQIKAGKDPVLPLGIKDQSQLERLIKFLEGEPDSRPDIPPPIQSTTDKASGELVKQLIQKLDSVGAKELADKLADKL